MTKHCNTYALYMTIQKVQNEITDALIKHANDDGIKPIKIKIAYHDTIIIPSVDCL